MHGRFRRRLHGRTPRLDYHVPRVGLSRAPDSGRGVSPVPGGLSSLLGGGAPRSWARPRGAGGGSRVRANVVLRAWIATAAAIVQPGLAARAGQGVNVTAQVVLDPA